MSGHSKWATIKHKKGALDAKRGKIFTRLIKEITIAAKGGGEILTATRDCAPPFWRPRPRTCRRKTSSAPSSAAPANWKASTTKRSRFEGYGPGGVAIIVEVLTDNRNRTVSEIRHAFSKNGGNLGESGSVRFMFSKKGVIDIEKTRGYRREADGHCAGAWRRRPARRRRCLGDRHRTPFL